MYVKTKTKEGRKGHMALAVSLEIKKKRGFFSSASTVLYIFFICKQFYKASARTALDIFRVLISNILG